MQWFIENRPDFREHLETHTTRTAACGGFSPLSTAIDRSRVLRYMLDEDEFLVALWHSRPLALS